MNEATVEIRDEWGGSDDGGPRGSVGQATTDPASARALRVANVLIDATLSALGVEPTGELLDRAQHALIRQLSASRSTDLDAELVADALRATGARPSVHRASFAEIAPIVHAEAPAMVSTEDGWFLLHGRRGGLLRVLHVDRSGVSTETWQRRGSLARTLRARSDHQHTWVLVERGAPAAASDHHHSAGHAGHDTPFGNLMRLVRIEKSELWVIVAYSVVIGLLSLVVPVATQSLVNTIAFGSLLQPLVVLTLLVAVVLGFAGSLRAIQAYLVEKLQQRVFVRLAIDVAERLPRLAASEIDRTHGPELVNRFFDVLTVQKSAASLLLDGLAIVLQAGIGMVLLAFYHPALLAYDAILLFALIFVIVFLGRRAVATSVDESRSKYATAAWLEEVARHRGVFRSSDGEAFAVARTEDLARSYIHARSAHFRVLFRQIIASISLHVVASAVLLGMGGWLVIQRQLTLGQLVAAELIVGAVLAGLVKFGKQLETLYDLLAAADKLGHLVGASVERNDGEPPHVTGPASIKARGLFAESGEARILSDASFHVAAGASCALLGSTGAGKSWLADLIVGFRAPHRGQIEIDGVNINELSLGDLRDRIVIVRDAEIFEGTILENVRVGRAGVSSHDARQALMTVGLAPLISDMPSGLNTKLSTGGWPLSRGEAILLSIARAVAARPGALILDGVLDEIEPNTRASLVAAISMRSTGITLLTMTCEPSVLSLHERRFTLERGRIVEEESLAMHADHSAHASPASTPYREHATRALPVMRLVRTHRGTGTLAKILLSLVVLVAVSLAIVPWVQTSVGYGDVTALAPLERQQNIESPIEGRLVRWHVREGSVVKAGDLLAEISDNDPDILVRLRGERDAMASRIDAARSRIAALDNRIASLESLRGSSLQVAEARRRMATNRVQQAEKSVEASEAVRKAAKLQFDRQRELQSLGMTSGRQLDVAEMEIARADIDVLRSRASLDQARNDEQGMRAELLRVTDEREAAIDDARSSRASADSELASAIASLQQIEVRLARQQNMVVSAPRDGTIFRLLVNQGTEMVRSGDAIANIIPDTAEPAVEIFVDGNDVPLISSGRHARIQFEGWPAVQFSGWPSVAVGTFGATVAYVDATDNGKGQFRVVLVPDGVEPWPTSNYLRQGVRAHGWIQLNQVSLGYELWRLFNGFPASVPQAPEKPVAGAKLKGK